MSRSRSLTELCNEMEAGRFQTQERAARGTTAPQFTAPETKAPESRALPRTDTDRGRERITQGMNVLSWDCGIKNLCYCLLESVDGPDEFRIVMWENFSLNCQSLMHATEKLVLELNKRSWMQRVDYVCIESQVVKNVQMKIMSHVIQTYFNTKGADLMISEPQMHTLPNGDPIAYDLTLGVPVQFIKAESKFSVRGDIEIPEKIEKLNRRTRNKRAAEYIATELLRRKKDHTALNFLLYAAKRDDLSDSFLQGLYFLRMQKRRNSQKKALRAKLIKQAEERRNEEEMEARLRREWGVPQGNRPPMVLDTTTGTREEEYDDTDRVNEGCQYKEEIALPQVYEAKSFTAHRYEGDVSGFKKFYRDTISINPET